MRESITVMGHPTFRALRRAGPRHDRHYVVVLELEDGPELVRGDTTTEAFERASLILEHYDARQEREHGTATG